MIFDKQESGRLLWEILLRFSHWRCCLHRALVIKAYHYQYIILFLYFLVINYLHFY